MSKGKLAAIIIGCSAVVIVVTVLVIPPLLDTQPADTGQESSTRHTDRTPGYSRSNPVGVDTPLSIWTGTTGLTTARNDYEVQITLLQVVRGEEAWQLVRERWRVNDPPEAGHEYILARLRFEYLTGPTPDTSYQIATPYLTAVASDGKEYRRASVLDPNPGVYANLYPGASHEGWATFQVAKTDAKPLMAFGRRRDGTEGIWFKLYP